MVLDGTKDAAGVADGDNMGGDVMRDDAPSTNHGALANGDPGQNLDVAAKPAVVADGNREGFLKSFVATFNIHWVQGRIASKVWPDEAVRPDGDPCAVHQVGTVVDECRVTDEAVAPIVRLAGRKDCHVLTQIREEFPLGLHKDGVVARMSLVECVAKSLGALAKGAEFLVGVGVIPVAILHLLAFSHH